MQNPGGANGFQLPPVPTWVRNLVAGLFALYVVELALSAGGWSLPAALVWRPFGAGFQVWQLVTRFVVNGGGVLGVLIALVVAWFALPAVLQTLDRERVAEATGAMAIGATLLPMLVDLTGLVPGTPILGWTSLVMGWIVLFGLAHPTGFVNLWFVIPVTGKTIVWGVLALEVLLFLVSPVTGTLEPIGVWIAAWGWWNYRGPGARRRYLHRQADRIERDLRRFEVIEGGKGQPQGDQDRDWIH